MGNSSETDSESSTSGEREAARIVRALGTIPDGGIVETTYVTQPFPVDATIRTEIGVAVWPFPPPASAEAAISSLGYDSRTPPCPPILGETAGAGSRWYVHRSESQVLQLIEAGSAAWTDLIVVSAFLQRSACGVLREEREPNGANLAELTRAARAWWIDTEGFAPLRRMLTAMEGFDRPWWVAGGWCIDLFLGRVTRVHGDVDICIARSDQLALQRFLTERGWRMMAPNDGELEPWRADDFIDLPRHQVHGHRDGVFLDLMFGEVQGGILRFRRNFEIVRTLERAVMRTEDGIPHLAPEIALLYKCRTLDDSRRQKDRDDFAVAAPHLGPERRAWLCWALTVWDLEHPWIARLEQLSESML